MNPLKIKVLMISSDRNIAVFGSNTAERMKEYGALVEELCIVLLSDKTHGLKEVKLGENVWIYPANSSSKFLRPMDAARLGKKIVLEKKFVRGESLITTQDPFECGWAGLKVKKKWRLPLETQLHTDPFSPYFSGLENRIRKFFVKSILRQSDMVRVVSNELKAKIERMTSAEVETLPIYVDQSRIQEQHMKFDVHSRYPWSFIMLAVSRLAPEKNLGVALEALSIVRKTFPDTGLIIVGSGPEEGRLRAVVKKLQLEGSVEFAGWQDDLASFYRTANLFIQTSLFEGYGLSLIEAGLSNLPVITTPVGIARELENGKDAYICPPENPALFAEGITDLIANNQKRENLKFNLKRVLETKLISKDDYLAKIKGNWEKASRKIK